MLDLCIHHSRESIHLREIGFISLCRFAIIDDTQFDRLIALPFSDAVTSIYIVKELRVYGVYNEVIHQTCYHWVWKRVVINAVKFDQGVNFKMRCITQW